MTRLPVGMDEAGWLLYACRDSHLPNPRIVGVMDTERRGYVIQHDEITKTWATIEKRLRKHGYYLVSTNTVDGQHWATIWARVEGVET